MIQHYNYCALLGNMEVSLFLCFGLACNAMTERQYEFYGA